VPQEFHVTVTGKLRTPLDRRRAREVVATYGRRFDDLTVASPV
jgi:hypothetical protein